MKDYYDTIIVQRGDAEAAISFADDCRKKDREINMLLAELERFRVPCVMCRDRFLPSDGERTCSDECRERSEAIDAADRLGDEKYHDR